jgi:tripartite-type tricarboxylate transporter receptor subunit TctC
MKHSEHSMSRRGALTALSLSPLAVVAQTAAPAVANVFPSKTIRLVVPYPAGGGNDLLARGVKVQWEKAWNQSVIVDNKPGANGALGTELTAKAPGDGYTVVMGSIATHVTSPLLKGKNAKYDVARDFVPLAMMGNSPLVLTVNTGVHANNLREFIALAKQKKENINYASVGNGSAGHLAAVMFEQFAGVDLLHVPYRGISQASTDLVGGQVQAAFSNVLNVLPFIRSGKLRALGITGTSALNILPDVPPIATVLPGYSAELWWGLFGPAGIPQDIVRKYNEETNRYLNDSAARSKWAEEGIRLNPMALSEYSQQIAKDTARWGELITARKITEDS